VWDTQATMETGPHAFLLLCCLRLTSEHCNGEACVTCGCEHVCWSVLHHCNKHSKYTTWLIVWRFQSMMFFGPVAFQPSDEASTSQGGVCVTEQSSHGPLKGMALVTNHKPHLSYFYHFHALQAWCHGQSLWRTFKTHTIAVSSYVSCVFQYSSHKLQR
jgi:hypothetical protein